MRKIFLSFTGDGLTKWRDAIAPVIDRMPDYERALDLDVLTVYRNMAAQTNGKLGNFADAERLARVGLEHTERDHKDEERTLWLTSIGLYAKLQGRFEEAEPLFRQATEFFTTTLGQEHTYTKTVAANLEPFLQKRGN